MTILCPFTWSRMMNPPLKLCNSFHVRKSKVLSLTMKCIQPLSSVPTYNFGLPGKGKQHNRKPYFRKHPPIQGEILFGIHPVLTALRERKRDFHKLLVRAKPHSNQLQKITSHCINEKITIFIEGIRTLDLLSGSRPHQGVCLDVSSLPLKDLCQETASHSSQGRGGDSPVWLLPFRVQDPMNFGAILRSAYFLGVDQVIFSQENSAPLNPVVSKASAAALEVINISATKTERELWDVLKAQKKSGWELLATVSTQSLQAAVSVPLTQLRIRAPTIVVMGNEGEGIGDELLEMCDHFVTIDSCKDNSSLAVDSLNVSVATGIILHSLLHSRKPG